MGLIPEPTGSSAEQIGLSVVEVSIGICGKPVDQEIEMGEVHITVSEE